MSPRASLARIVRRNGWVVGLFVLLGAAADRHQDHPARLWRRGLRLVVRAALPFAFAAAGQAIVVIAGGVDLSIASMMALTSVTAAALMEGGSEEFAILVVLLMLLMAWCWARSTACSS